MNDKESGLERAGRQLVLGLLAEARVELGKAQDEIEKPSAGGEYWQGNVRRALEVLSGLVAAAEGKTAPR